MDIGRRLSLLLVTFALTLTTPGLVGSPASAATEWKTWTMPFTRTGQTWIRDLNTCVEHQVRGKIVWSIREDVPNMAFSYRNPRLVDPSVTVWTYDRCVTRYTDYRERRWVQDLKIGATIYGSNRRTCRWNASFGVGLPFSASLSVTPECEKTKVAKKWWSRVGARQPIRSASSGIDGQGQVWKIDGYTHESWDDGRHRVCFRVTSKAQVWRTIDGQSIDRRKQVRLRPVCRNLYDSIR